MILGEARNFPDDFTTTANTLKRALRHHHIFKCLNSLPRKERTEISSRCLRRKAKMCNVKKVCVGESEKIFLDMSSHCVTNIWEWSFRTNLCCGRKLVLRLLPIHSLPSWHRKKEIFTIWILASRVNKIEDKVSWYRITFETAEKRWKTKAGAVCASRGEMFESKFGEIKYFHYRNFLFGSISTLAVVPLLAKSIS